MEYGIQVLAGIGMVFAVITDLWQKKIAVYAVSYTHLDVYKRQEVILQKLDIDSSISDQTILSLIEESVLRFAHTVYLSMDEKKEVIQRTFYAIRKLDVLQEILEDQEITEIMVNGPDQIFIEKQGRLEPYPKKFLSKEKLEDVIQQIVGKVNRTVNESSPIAVSYTHLDVYKRQTKRYVKQISIKVRMIL